MLNKWLKKWQHTTNQAPKKSSHKEQPMEKFAGSLIEKKETIQSVFGHSSDLVMEDIQFTNQDGLLCYFTTLTDWSVVTTKILEPLADRNLQLQSIVDEDEWLRLGKATFSGSDHRFVETEKDVIDAILDGYAVVIINGFHSVLKINVRKTEFRSIEEPSSQTIVRGPKEGFNENIKTNLSLLRRKIRNPGLRFETYIVGTETKTEVSLAYIHTIINKGILKEAQTRLQNLDTNAILESGTLEELIEDKTLTPFPMLYNTERADTVAAHLLAGKFAIFVDGSPYVLTAPTVFNDFLSVSEDYYQKFLMSSLIRCIRYFSFLLATLLPAFYVAIITFHQELIPTALIISLIAQREGIPFPAVIEALLMEITFEILREAGIRMPRAVGGTISIVGGLVIGQAAVEAGIVSNIMVIVVALTAISSFVIPVYTFAISTRLLRFLFLLLASTLGLYGVFLGMIAMVAHLASLRSFSVPYLAPFAPFTLQDQKDTFFRMPNWTMKMRPTYLQTENEQKHTIKSPSPPKQGESG